MYAGFFTPLSNLFFSNIRQHTLSLSMCLDVRRCRSVTVCGNIRLRVVYECTCYFIRCVGRVGEILCVHKCTFYFIRAVFFRRTTPYPAPYGNYLLTIYVIYSYCIWKHKKACQIYMDGRSRKMYLLWQWDNLSIACNL